MFREPAESLLALKILLKVTSPEEVLLAKIGHKSHFEMK